MFTPFLDLLACPDCRRRLLLAALEAAPGRTSMRIGRAERSRRAKTIPPEVSVGFLEPFADALESEPGELVEVRSGVLVCAGCERWYPVRDSLPEILPDHLRSWSREEEWLRERRPAFVERQLGGLWELLLPRTRARSVPEDEGAGYKSAEMAIGSRNVSEGFFGPARVAPFNPSRPAFSLDLLARFATTATRLDCGVNAVVLDLGAGYGWTTEWLVRLGYRAVGIDLCREYLLAGIPRMREHRPHLVVGDVEHLPLRSECVEAVLAFDAFHHFPDRTRVLREIERVLRPGGKIVMVEPGKDHEHAPEAIAAMRQHGILERGFDLADLRHYAAGSGFQEIALHRSDAHPHAMYSLRKKGRTLSDSIAPRALLAEIRVSPAEGLVQAGLAPELVVTLFNRGDTLWLHRTDGGPGAVRLGASLYDGDRRLLDEHYARVLLPRPLRPGEGLSLQCALPPIPRPGRYVVELDMVDEGFLWFKDYVYRVVAWPLWVEGEEVDSASWPAATGSSPVEIVPAELPLPTQPVGERLQHWRRRAWQVLRTEGPRGLASKIAEVYRRRSRGAAG